MISVMNCTPYDTPGFVDLLRDPRPDGYGDDFIIIYYLSSFLVYHSSAESMEVLSSSLDLRSFQALINGLIKKNFYNQSSITIEFLQEQLFAGSELEPNEIVNEISQFEEVLCSVCP
jgi:hypothetical protein